jgi:hypothetical protein
MAPFQFDDPRQERIYRRLKVLVGQGPADFFEDACRLMHDPASLRTSSHLVSHSLREIESALRDVLESIGEREQRLQKSKNGEQNHKDEISAILRALHIPETDPVAAAWLGLPGYGLHARSHRNALTSARPADEDFRQFWNDMQAIFDVVLDKFETCYLAVYSLLDQLLAKSIPTQGDIDTLKNKVSSNLIAHSYFFDHLTSLGWLDLLQRNGLFQHPPPPEVDAEKGTAYPPWPQSRYIARMAPQAPERTLDIILTVPLTENFRIYHDFADAAAAMPPALAARWAEREAVRINTSEGLFGLLPEKLGALMNHLLRGQQVPAALGLARSLLEILPDQRIKESREDEYSLPPEPRARFSTWTYKRIIEQMIPLIPLEGRISAFDLLSDLLEKAITLSKPPTEHGREVVDHSAIWLPDLEDRPRANHLKQILAPAVRDLVLAIAVQDPAQLRVLVEKLQRRPYGVFHRVALDLLRRHPDIDLITAQLTDRGLFDARDTRQEYEVLMRDWFCKIETKDQRKVLAWIEAGPDDDEAYKHWHKEWSGQEASEEDVIQHKKRWQRAHLAPIHTSASLTSDLKQQYEALVSEVGPPDEGLTKNPRAEVWRGPTSPQTADDFESMSIDDIVCYLRAWEPTGGFMSPSRNGLGRELTETVRKSPLRFASELAKFQGLDPTYVRSLLEGFRQGINTEAPLPWSEILSLCRWIVLQPIVIAGRQVDKWNDDPDWGYTRKAIAGLIGVGLHEGGSTITFDLRNQVWSILEALTNDPDPSPEDEVTSGQVPDPAHVAINSTRGEAMQVVMVNYALWVRRFLEQLPDGAVKIAQGFNEMPEVRLVLEAHLDISKDPSLAIRSVYGRWLPKLAYLDTAWTKDHLQAIFPHEEGLKQYRDAAWDTYLVFCPPFGSVFEIAHEEYRTAIEQLGLPGTTRFAVDSVTATRLAEHLMILYWNGNLPLEDVNGLLPRFFEKATDALRGEALDFLGRSLGQQAAPLPNEISVRLRKLWDTRLAAIRSATPTNHTAELAAFGWWFVSEKFDNAWAIAQLIAALTLVQKTQPDYHVVERLVDLAETMPLEAVACLTLMIQGDKEGWELETWRDDSRKILATAIASGNQAARQAARELVNRLAARGMPDYSDLLQGK